MENLGNGVIRHSLYDGRIVVYQATQNNADALETWVDAVMDDLEHDYTNRPYFALHDLSGVDLSASWHIAADQLADRHPTYFQGRNAILVNDDMRSNIMYFLDDSNFTDWLPQVDRSFFLDRDLAMQWLQSGVFALV